MSKSRVKTKKKCGAAISETLILDFLKRQNSTLQIYSLSKLFWTHFNPRFRPLQTQITIEESAITIFKLVKSVQNHFFQPLQNLPLVSDGGDRADKMGRSPVETHELNLQKWNFTKCSIDVHATHRLRHENPSSQHDLHPKCPPRETQTRFLNVTPYEKS